MAATMGGVARAEMDRAATAKGAMVREEVAADKVVTGRAVMDRDREAVAVDRGVMVRVAMDRGRAAVGVARVRVVDRVDPVVDKAAARAVGVDQPAAVVRVVDSQVGAEVAEAEAQRVVEDRPEGAAARGEAVTTAPA